VLREVSTLSISNIQKVYIFDIRIDVGITSQQDVSIMAILSNPRTCGGKKIGMGIFKNVWPILKTQAEKLASTKTNVTSFYQLLRLYNFGFLSKMIPSL